MQQELIGVRDLYEKHLVQISRLTTLERDCARLNGERAQYIASRAQAKGKITETELQIIQVDKDMVSEVSKDLRETNDKIGEMIERKVAAEDQLRRVDIRAPQDGMVLQSTVHTVGGVITAGDAAHADRAAGRRSPGRGQGQSGRYRQAPDRPEDAAAPVRVQPAHHAGAQRRRQPRLARRHHRPAHRPELLHHPRVDVRRKRSPSSATPG